MNAHNLTSDKNLPSDSAAMDPSTPALEPMANPIVPGKKLTFLDLPSETKKGIFKHVG